MPGIVLNEKQFLARLNAISRTMQRNYTKRLRMVVDVTTQGVLPRTPVHTGRTVRNWRWTMDAPAAGVLSALGGGAPGQTSGMALGSEPRRGANQEDARMTKDTLDFSRPWRRFFLTNNTPGVDLLEAGLLPDASKTRAPSGMLGITLREVAARLAQTRGTILR